MDRGGQIREEALGARERFVFRVDGVIDRAAARLDLPAAELLLAEALAEARDHRRTGDEHARKSLVITE